MGPFVVVGETSGTQEKNYASPVVVSTRGLLLSDVLPTGVFILGDEVMMGKA